MRLAINQPYWNPYAGWFRLFAASDRFVFLDDVQFNRRGYVHRYISENGWVTLPIKKTDRDATMIRDLEWRDNLHEPSVVDFVIESVKHNCDKLDLPFNAIRSSELQIKAKGQDRIIAICKEISATEYVNSPGGCVLYDEREFSKNGIRLTFLKSYRNSYASVAERLMGEPALAIKQEIVKNI